MLARGPAALERARELFGDERADYGAALERHYVEGPPADWARRLVSAYATMHPSEDWAETFAHYLHIRDALQTAAAHGVRVDGPGGAGPPAELGLGPRRRPRLRVAARRLAAATYALNAINRSMGRADLYPFVLPAPVVEKLAFVHELVRTRAEPFRPRRGRRAPAAHSATTTWATPLTPGPASSSSIRCATALRTSSRSSGGRPFTASAIGAASLSVFSQCSAESP